MRLEDKQFLDLLAPKKDDAYSLGIKKLVVEMRERFRKQDLVDGAGAAKEMAVVKQYDDARKRVRYWGMVCPNLPYINTIEEKVTP